MSIIDTKIWVAATATALLLFGLIGLVLSEATTTQDAYDLWMQTCDRGEDECLVMWDTSPRLQNKYIDLASRKN